MTLVWSPPTPVRLGSQDSDCQERAQTAQCGHWLSPVVRGGVPSHATQARGSSPKEVTQSKQKKTMTNPTTLVTAGLLLWMTGPHGRGGPHLNFKIYHWKSFQTVRKGSSHSPVTLRQESEVSPAHLEIQGQSWVRTFCSTQKKMLTGFMGHAIDKPIDRVS